jgi:type IV pilus assembly protein PilB
MSKENNRRKLGTMLVEAGLITKEQIDTALANQREWGGKIGSTLVNMGFIKEECLGQFLSRQLNMPNIDISSIRIKKETIDLVPKELAEKHMLIPVTHQEQKGITRILIAMSDPLDLSAIDDIQSSKGLKVKAGIAPEGAIWRAIQIYYYGNKSISPKIDAPEKPLKIDLSDIDGKFEIFREREETKRVTDEALEKQSLIDTAAEVRALKNLLVRKGVITVSEFFNEVNRVKK